MCNDSYPCGVDNVEHAVPLWGPTGSRTDVVWCGFWGRLGLVFLISVFVFNFKWRRRWRRTCFIFISNVFLILRGNTSFVEMKDEDEDEIGVLGELRSRWRDTCNRTGSRNPWSALVNFWTSRCTVLKFYLKFSFRHLHEVCPWIENQFVKYKGRRVIPFKIEPVEYRNDRHRVHWQWIKNKTISRVRPTLSVSTYIRIHGNLSIMLLIWHKWWR